MRVLAMAPTTAIVPPIAATHGPHEASWNVGGNAIASAEAETTVVPPRITRIPPDRDPWTRNHHEAGIRTTAATAAIIDQRRLGTHAPSRRSPAPVRVHGPAVASSPKTAPATTPHDPATARAGSGGVVSVGSPNSARHSGPSTRPRTGTAHERQTGSSQALHRATAALLG